MRSGVRWGAIGVAVAALVGGGVGVIGFQTRYSSEFSHTVQGSLDGQSVPMVEVRLDELPAMTSSRRALDGGRTVELRSNLPVGDPVREQVLHQLAAVYLYVERESGRPIPGDTLLYVGVVDEIPVSYRISGRYAGDVPWSHVGFVLIGRLENDPVGSPGAPLNRQLYDTIPHELGHSVLRDLVRHDADGGPSHHTRWFLDGVCEVLAKGFAAEQHRPSAEHFLRRRRLDSLAQPEVRQALFRWPQDDGPVETLESDLYGAAMLVVQLWTRQVPLPTILSRLAEGSSADGEALVARMSADLGRDREAILDAATALGRQTAASAVDR
ncbi:MAG: hypothetical protein H0V89_14200 [Deltaproteobacteria bacterium]|nr:hypothetical protein [Deltaproteobacteria bacterium]